MELRLNEAGRFLLCSVCDIESKRYCVIFPEGRGLLGGWNILVENLHDLGVDSLVRFLDAGGSVTPPGEKGSLSKTYAKMAKPRPGRIGDYVWLELGERELLGGKDQLDQCLVGWWGVDFVPAPDLDLVRSWASHLWLLKGRLRVAFLGKGLLLFEFESLSEAERVLARGKRRLKNILHLTRWNPEAGCFLQGAGIKEA